MPLIKDVKYAEFLKTGLITPMQKKEFTTFLNKIQHRYKAQARAVCILVFYTGRRPSEILDLPCSNVTKEQGKIKILFATRKGGKYTVMYYPLNEHFKEVYKYVSGHYPGTFLGYCFRSKSINRVKYKLQDGSERVKEYTRTNNVLYYHFKKWFGITPYFFRHNRFSDMAGKGATFQEIKHAKGAASLKSVEPYIHLSVQQAKRMSKYFR